MTGEGEKEKKRRGEERGKDILNHVIQNRSFMIFVIDFSPVCRLLASVTPTNNKLASNKKCQGRRSGGGGRDREVKEEISSKHLVVQQRNQAIDQFASS